MNPISPPAARSFQPFTFVTVEVRYSVLNEKGEEKSVYFRLSNVYFRLSNVPNAPSLSILTSSPTTNTEISLEWTNSSGADNYTLYRHTSEIDSGTLVSATEVKTITGNSTADTIPGVGTWYYAVVANNINGISDLSNSPFIVVISSGTAIPGYELALISLSSLIAIVIVVRKFKKSKISKF